MGAEAVRLQHATREAPASPAGAAALLTRAEEAHARGDVHGALAAAREAWAAGVLEAIHEGSFDSIAGSTAHPPADTTRDRAGWLLACQLHRCSDYPAQLALAETLVPRLRRRGGPEFGEYLRWVVLAGCELGRFDLALPLAYEAVALADADGSPRVRAMATNAFAVCFERMGDPWQSERLMGEALVLAREAGAPFELFVTLNNLCAVLIGAHHQLRGVGAEPGDPDALAPLHRALPMAREAVGLLGQVPQPQLRPIVEGNLGEILLHLGRPDEARALLAGALAIATAQGQRPQQQRVRCSQAELALREHRPADALALVRQVLADAVPVPQTALRAHHAGYLAAQGLGDTATALHHLEQQARIERQRSVRQLRAQSELFVTRVESERLRERARVLEVVTRHDPLTGLGNRRELDARLPVLLQATRAAGQPLALALLDIDNFKAINDGHGHQVGDRVLVAVAELLRSHLRASDMVARLGGDEFVLALPEATGSRALELCERIRVQIAGHDWSALVPGLPVSISIGVAAAPPHEAEPLLARADAALYRAKGGGRNRTELG